MGGGGAHRHPNPTVARVGPWLTPFMERHMAPPSFTVAARFQWQKRRKIEENRMESERGRLCIRRKPDLFFPPFFMLLNIFIIQPFKFSPTQSPSIFLPRYPLPPFQQQPRVDQRLPVQRLPDVRVPRLQVHAVAQAWGTRARGGGGGRCGMSSATGLF